MHEADDAYMGYASKDELGAFLNELLEAERAGTGVALRSAESAGVTGRVFEVEGGLVSLADGWQHGPRRDKGARWEPAELGPVIAELLAEAPAPAPVYGASA